ncbi:MAG: hypothetical protein FD180_2793 [Planctomycetota bacterium]|nr:MAG: hypothetical protein FD180_2793 [Planctomycetota bacterium]
MQTMALFDEKGRSIRRVRTHEEIMADIPPEVKEARRILAAGGDPGPMPIDHLLYFGGKRHQEILKRFPGYEGLGPPDYDVDRPGDLGLNGVLGPTPAPASKIMTKFGAVFIPQDLVLTPQSEWKNRPGIQVITGDHGPDCCCVCCCCKEPEPPLIFMGPEKDCPCPRARKSVIGVFIDGITNSRDLLKSPATHEENQRKTDRDSAIRDLCTRYGGESWLYRGLRMPFDAESQASTIADALIDRICRNHRWIQSESRWEKCEPIEIDLFGFSRGGATAVLVAHHLSKRFKCLDCPHAEPLGPFTVRFLGIIDPEGRALPDIGIFPRRDIDGTDMMPSNVKYFYAAYSDRHTFWTFVDLPVGGRESTDLEDELGITDFHLAHEDMGKKGLGPISELERFYEDHISDPAIPDEASSKSCEYKE